MKIRYSLNFVLYNEPYFGTEHVRHITAKSAIHIVSVVLVSEDDAVSLYKSGLFSVDQSLPPFVFIV